MASVPPIMPQPEEESLLVRIARAVMERERQKLGIPGQERAANADVRAGRELDLKAAETQAALAKLAQEMEFAPATHKSALDLSAARADESRAEAEYKRAGGRQPYQSPPNVGSFEDFVIRSYGANPTAEQIAAARKTYNQADDYARTPRTAISLELPMPVMDKQTGQLTYVSKGDVLKQPDRYGPPPTTAERNVASGSTAGQQSIKMAQKRAMPVLQDIGSRALALNKGGEGGFLERAGGAARRVGGRMGVDPAADLYQSGIRGFVPLFARSVGHVGVLTELDVQRTEDLFPRIGDAENVTREKLGRLQRIMTGQEPMPFQFEQPEYTEEGITQPSQSAAQPAAGSGGFRVVGVREQ